MVLLIAKHRSGMSEQLYRNLSLFKMYHPGNMNGLGGLEKKKNLLIGEMKRSQLQMLPSSNFRKFIVSTVITEN